MKNWFRTGVMDEELVQNGVMDEKFVKNFVLDAKIDPKVVFKIGGWKEHSANQYSKIVGRIY